MVRCGFASSCGHENIFSDDAADVDVRTGEAITKKFSLCVAIVSLLQITVFAEGVQRQRLYNLHAIHANM